MAATISADEPLALYYAAAGLDLEAREAIYHRFQAGATVNRLSRDLKIDPNLLNTLYRAWLMQARVNRFYSKGSTSMVV